MTSMLRIRLKLPHESFELIPFIDEDKDRYLHVVVDRMTVQTMKVNRF